MPQPRMQILVLGHLEATVDDRPVALGGAKQRAVLAMLGLEANRPVTADRLIEGLWGEEPPPSAAKMVQNYVLRLRKELAADGGAEIVTRGRAYELRIDRELVDVCRLERLVAEAARGAQQRERECRVRRIARIDEHVSVAALQQDVVRRKPVADEHMNLRWHGHAELYRPQRRIFRTPPAASERIVRSRARPSTARIHKRRTT